MLPAIWNMAVLHLQIIFKDRSTFIQAFAVPAILMMVLGLSVREDDDLALYLDVADEDQSALSQELLNALHTAAAETGSVTLCVYGTADLPEGCDLSASDDFAEVGQTRLEDQQSTATLLIPAGFGDALARGEGFSLEYRSNDQLNTPTLVRTVVETAITEVNSSLAIAQAGVQGVASDFGGYGSDEERNAAFQELRANAQQRLAAPPVQVQRESADEEVVVGFGARQSVPGMASMFVLFTLLSICVKMVEERQQGTLQRLFTLPARRAAIVLGEIAGTFAFGVLQFLIFIAFGTLLGLDWGNDYLAILALVLAFCLAGTAMGFLLSTLVRTPSQAANMVTLGGLLLAPLGGAWWPLRIAPTFMQTLGRLSPIAWVMEGFQQLLYYNGGLVDVLPQVGALLLFAVIFTLPAIFNFRYE